MKSCRILVVEDETVVSMEIAQRLRFMGYEVAGAAITGAEAVAMAEQQRPHLILMDIRLIGEMDGIEAATEIRRKFHLPVIFLTAYSEDETLERAKVAEPYGYLLKPFTDGELKSTIEIALHRHRAEQEILRLNRLYDVLSQVNQAIVHNESREELLSAVCRVIVERGALDLAWIGRFDPTCADIHVVSYFANGSGALPGAFSRADINPDAWRKICNLMREGRSFVCAGCGEHPNLYLSESAPSRYCFKSCGSFPIRSQGKVWGMLSVGSSQPGFLHERELGLLQEVAMDVTYALDRIDGETRRKQAEAAFRESEERLRLFIEYAPASLAMFDREMRYISCSQRWLKDFGLEGRGLIGLSHYEVFPEIPERWKEVHRRGLAGEVVRAEEDRFERLDGSVQWSRWEMRPWRDGTGEVAGIVIFREDITARKQSEAALRESERRQKALLDGIPDMAWLKDAEGRFVAVNAAFARAAALKPEAIVGKTDFDVWPRENAERYTADDVEVIASGRRKRVEEPILDAAGHMAWIETIKVPIYSDDGKVEGTAGIARDYTEHVLARKALQESEQRFRDIATTMGESIWETDAEGRFTYVSDGLWRYLDYSSDEVLGKTPFHFMPAEDAEWLAAELRAIAERREPFRDIENIRVAKDGSRRILSTSGVPILDDTGAFRGYRGVDRDITREKRAAQELDAYRHHLEQLVAERTAELTVAQRQTEQALARVAESEAMFRTMVEQAPLGIALVDSVSGRIHEVNEQYAKIVARSRDELTSFNWTQITHPEDLPEQLERMAKLTAGEAPAFRMDKRYILPDGSQVWVNLTVAPVTLEAAEDPYHLAFIEDISYRKEVEERLRAVTESAPDGIIMTDSRDLITFWNPAAEQILGYRAEEVLGRKLHELLLPERYMGDFLAAFPEFQRTGRGRNMGKTTHTFAVHKDGKEIAVAVSQSAVSLRGTWHAVGIVRDITLQLELEENLRKAKEAAETATMAKSSFLANMSHEIRTPMNAIIGFAHLLKRDPLTAGQLGQLDKMSNAAGHLLQIINDILDFSKIEAGKITLEDRDFEPARVIDHVCGLLSDKVAAKDLDFIVDMKNVPLMLRGDDMRFGQILLNLVSNAEKFTEKGGISIVVRAIDQLAEMTVLRFEVLDSGVGMTDEQVERLFNAFEQADSSTTRRFGGTGLGLAICKRLVELMGGRIGVESEIGRGTLFWMEIPFRKASRKPKQLANLESLQGMRVLVMDDREDAREILAAMLSELDMRADTAVSGEAGLAAVLEADQAGDPYGLVIIDWKMPGMDGIETARRLQALDLTSLPTHLMVTAYGEQLPRAEATRAGISKVLSKPVTPSVLRDALAEALAQASPLPILFAEERTERELAKRCGSHILLVEDNVINQEVACELLKAVGMKVSVADNGQTALEMVGIGRYDLVLMDVQMPVMDGLQATEAIRRLPGWRSIPILAMTAGAFDEDVARCLQAGMNDHVAKPVQPGKLNEVLVKWLPVRQDVDKVSEDKSAPNRSAPDQAMARDLLPMLEAIGGLDVAACRQLLGGDLALYVRLLGQFADRHGDAATLLSAQLAAEDYAAFHRAAHTLKGVAGNLGAKRVQEAAAVLEKTAMQGFEARDELREHLTVLARVLAHLLDDLRTVLPETRDEHKAEIVDWAEVAKVLAQLEPLLAADDSAANDLFEQSRSALFAALGDEAKQLERQIQDFDYADALATLRAIRKAGVTGDGNA